MSDRPRIAEDAIADHAADLYSMAGSRVCCCETETATTEETR